MRQTGLHAGRGRASEACRLDMLFVPGGEWWGPSKHVAFTILSCVRKCSWARVSLRTHTRVCLYGCV